MPRSLTPDEVYARLLDEAWWRFNQADRARRDALGKLLRQAADELSGWILRTASPAGKIERRHMETLQRAMADTMSRFRSDYERAVDGMISATISEAYQDQLAGLDGYMGSSQFHSQFALRLGDVTQQVADVIHQRVIGGLSLSDRIWRLDWSTRNLLERDILNSVMRGESAADMARRIQGFLEPGRAYPVDVPSRAHSGQPADVAYNAYRLARTEINQTYAQVRQETDATLAQEGLALGSRWVLSPNHRERISAATEGRFKRDICDRWAERLPGSDPLPYQPEPNRRQEMLLLQALRERGIDPRGVYLAGMAPTDHPNGLCRTQTVMLGREEILRSFGF